MTFAVFNTNFKLSVYGWYLAAETLFRVFIARSEVEKLRGDSLNAWIDGLNFNHSWRDNHWPEWRIPISLTIVGIEPLRNAP